VTYFAFTKKAVRRAASGRDRLHEMIRDYVQHRAQIDPDWDRAINFEADTDTIAFDPNGDVEIEWEETGRCGDRDYYRKEFPAEHLWDPEAMEKIKVEVAERVAAEAKKTQDRLEARQKAQEVQDLKLLSALQEKYGGQAVSSDPG